MDGTVITLGIFIFAQTVAAVWWAATVTARLSYMANALQEAVNDIGAISTDRYTATKAKEDLQIVHGRIDRLQERLRDIERDQQQRHASDGDNA